MKQGDKVLHPAYGAGLVREVYADKSVDVFFGEAERNVHYDDLSYQNAPVKSPRKTSSRNGQYFMHDRKRGYVAEVLNQLPRFNGRITGKAKDLPAQEQEDLRSEARAWLAGDGVGFEDFAYDLLQAYGGEFLAIELPWQLWRRSSTDLMQLVETVRTQITRAQSREQKLNEVAA